MRIFVLILPLLGPDVNCKEDLIQHLQHSPHRAGEHLLQLPEHPWLELFPCGNGCGKVLQNSLYQGRSSFSMFVFPDFIPRKYYTNFAYSFFSSAKPAPLLHPANPLTQTAFDDDAYLGRDPKRRRNIPGSRLKNNDPACGHSGGSVYYAINNRVIQSIHQTILY